MEAVWQIMWVLTNAKDKPLTYDERIEGSAEPCHTLPKTTSDHTCKAYQFVKHTVGRQTYQRTSVPDDRSGWSRSLPEVRTAKQQQLKDSRQVST